jgi:hypothetical protein
MVAKIMKKLAIVLCIFFFILMCNLAKAYSETIELPAGEEKIKVVNLNNGDYFFIQVTIVGNPMNFSISDPDGYAVLNQSASGRMDFQFTATKSGVYNLHFNNEFSDETKFVTFNYNVQRYIFGFPQEYIILFAIVGLALIAVVIFVALSPKP